jgi:hypothetical protein
MGPTRRIRSIALPVVLVVGSALASTAQAGPLTMTRSVSPQEQAAASVYWTRGRIAAAPALALPVDTGRPEVVALDERAAMGPMGMAPPGTSAPDAGKIARASYPKDWADSEEALMLEEDGTLHDGRALDEPADEETGTAGVYTAYDVNVNAALWKVYPHRWGGKLTFITPTGGASCSATSISGNNIVTAAHCVYDSTANQWYTNWVFAPGFRNGTAPYGTFAAKTCTILTAWANLSGSFKINTWSRHDVAVCTMKKNTAGQTLNGAVGWAGRLWNYGYNQLVFNSGYPARDYTNATIANGPGQYLRSCTAETFLQATETLGSGCRWGPGISGGSWLVSYKPFLVSGYVNSVNSGLFVGQQNIYGARFNSSNIVLLCAARGC